MIRYCLIDLDGVLADFVRGACLAHGIDSPYGPNSPHNGNFEMADVCGMSGNQFWSVLKSHEFWESIPPTNDFKSIISVATAYFYQENIAICSAMSRSPFSASGKMAWIHRHLPEFERRVILTPAKHFLAQKGSVLIDDRDANVKKFCDAGGEAVLVPRWWNQLHHKARCPIGSITNTLESILIG